MVLIIAVGCFAGVRPEESARLEWEMIDFERKHIDLPASITKDGERCIVDMSDNLIEWLSICRKRTGKILPDNFRRKRWVLSRAMRWQACLDDILRHSFGSYHLSRYRNAALTVEQMGHKNARMLYAHLQGSGERFCRRGGLLEPSSFAKMQRGTACRLNPSECKTVLEIVNERD